MWHSQHSHYVGKLISMAVQPFYGEFDGAAVNVHGVQQRWQLCAA
jgi:hypothetical protein